jgi:hypothetical protein
MIRAFILRLIRRMDHTENGLLATSFQLFAQFASAEVTQWGNKCGKQDRN